jgi:hypothetical protein
MAREALLPSPPKMVRRFHSAVPGQTDLRLVYNMASLARTYQFRSHLGRECAELRQFSRALPI